MERVIRYVEESKSRKYGREGYEYLGRDNSGSHVYRELSENRELFVIDDDEMSKEEVIIEELSSDLRSVEEKVVDLRRELENLMEDFIMMENEKNNRIKELEEKVKGLEKINEGLRENSREMRDELVEYEKMEEELKENRREQSVNESDYRNKIEEKDDELKKVVWGDMFEIKRR